MALDPVQESLLEMWETHMQRVARYRTNWAYYKAREYLDDIGEQHIKDRQLFRYIRHVFGYVTQVVDTDARFTCKRRIQVEAEEQIQEIIDQMWERSNFQRDKYKLMRYVSNLGDGFLILVNDGQAGEVLPRLVVANSEDIDLMWDPDDQDTLLTAKQSYITQVNGRHVSRDWIYTPEAVYRYTDGRLDRGYPVPHPFGEVPVIHIKAIDIGEAWGLCSWHNIQPQLDEINELLSFANRILLRYADPMLIMKGVVPPPDEDASGRKRAPLKRDASGNWTYYIPNEASLEYLEYKGDVLPRIRELVQDIDRNIKDQLPELALSSLRDQSGLSGYAVSLKLADLIAKIDELRGNLADALEWANALAVRAVLRSNAPLEEFKSSIRFEPVLPEDVLEQLQAEEIEQRLGIVSKHELLRRRGKSDTEIDQMLQEIEDEQGGEAFGLRRLRQEVASGGAVAG